GRSIRVNDDRLDVDRHITFRESEKIQGPEIVGPASIEHLLLHSSFDSRIEGQLIFAAKGRTITTTEAPDAPSPQYLGVVEAPYLDSIATSNREALVDLDPGYLHLKAAAFDKIAQFTERY